MRKVLMIAYIFPPRGGSGVQRTVKFAKYLPEFGWQPVVLTVSNPPTREADYSLLQELPAELPIYRVPDLDKRYLVEIARKFSSRNGPPSKTPGSTLQRSKSPNPTKRRPVWTSFVRTWLMIPDPCIRWFPTALWAGLKLAKQCEVIYSTSAPFTNHLVAWFLRIVSGKPWLADFRDPWTQYVIYQHLSQSRSRIDAVLEHHMLKAADMVSVTCPATAQGFQELYPSLSKDKFVVLTNGYDAEDFTRPVKPSSDRFTIAYTGRFDDRKNTSSFFLEALKDLRSEHPEVVSEIEIIFAGSSGDNIRSLLKQWSLEENIKLIGYVPHLESVELLLKSHILLLTLNDELGVNLTYPGKLFEYLAAQKSILALVPEGATADLIRDMNAGPIIAPYNVSAIKQAILDLYRKYKQSESLAKDYNNLQLFERRTLTRKLAQHLDSMTQG